MALEEMLFKCVCFIIFLIPEAILFNEVEPLVQF